MALEAGLRLSCGLQLELARHFFHDGMAVSAHQTARIVRAAVPISAFAAFVTVKADRIVLFRGTRLIFRTERNNAANAASAACLRMRRARTVAIFAVELARLCLADSAHERLAESLGVACMTSHADLRANKARFDRSLRAFGAAGDGAGFCLLWRGDGAFLQKIAQCIEGVVGVGELRLVLNGLQSSRCDFLGEFP